MWDDGFESATTTMTTTTTTIGITTASGVAVALVSSSSSVFGEDSNQDCARNQTDGDARVLCNTLFLPKPSLLILFLFHFCAIFCFGRRET